MPARLRHGPILVIVRRCAVGLCHDAVRRGRPLARRTSGTRRNAGGRNRPGGAEVSARIRRTGGAPGSRATPGSPTCPRVCNADSAQGTVNGGKTPEDRGSLHTSIPHPLGLRSTAPPTGPDRACRRARLRSRRHQPESRNGITLPVTRPRHGPTVCPRDRRSGSTTGKTGTNRATPSRGAIEAGRSRPTAKKWPRRSSCALDLLLLGLPDSFIYELLRLVPRPGLEPGTN